MKTNFLYFIERGNCRVKSKSLDIMKDFEMISMLNPSDFFGEIALVFDSPRTYTVETFQYTTLGSLT